MIVGHKETKENWAWLSLDNPDEVVYENGDKEPLEKSHYVITFGKYKGTTLDKLDDEWYLKFLQKSADKDDDWLLNKMLNL